MTVEGKENLRSPAESGGTEPNAGGAPIGEAKPGAERNGGRDKDPNVENLLKRFNSMEELAKSKISTDREYAKAVSEKKATEVLLTKKYYSAEKKLAQANPLSLIELYGTDSETAEAITKELFRTDFSSFLTYVESTLLNRERSEGEDLDATIAKIMGEERKRSKPAPKNHSRTIEMLAEAKAAQKIAALRNANKAKEEASSVESEIQSFLSAKGIEDGTDEGKAFMETFKELSEGKKLSKESANKVLRAAFALFSEENEEFNAKRSEAKRKLASSSVNRKKSAGGKGLVYTEDDLKSARMVGMKIEDYVEIKKKYNI